MYKKVTLGPNILEDFAFDQLYHKASAEIQNVQNKSTK